MRFWTPSSIALCCFVLLVTQLLWADDPPKKGKSTLKKDTASSDAETKEKPSARPKNLLPLYRFYDNKLNECLYSTSDDEIETWRADKRYTEQTIVGDVSPGELPDTIRLWRAIRKKDAKHYFYLRAPGKAIDLTVESNEFKVYVWKKAGDGRIPIYSHTWTDGTDVYIEASLELARKFKDDSRKALGVNRPPLSGRDFSQPVFFVYPHSEGEKSKESQETAKSKPESAK